MSASCRAGGCPGVAAAPFRFRRRAALLSLAALALVAAAAPPPAAAHPVYIGRVAASLGDSALSGRLYVNRLDFLQALAEERGGALYDLSRAQLDSLAFQYLRGCLRAAADGDTLSLLLGASGQERLDVWFDFAFPVTQRPSLLYLEVAVLFESFAEQRNLLELTTPQGVKRHVFTPQRPVLIQEVAPP